MKPSIAFLTPLDPRMHHYVFHGVMEKALQTMRCPNVFDEHRYRAALLEFGYNVAITSYCSPASFLASFAYLRRLKKQIEREIVEGNVHHLSALLFRSDWKTLWLMCLDIADKYWEDNYVASEYMRGLHASILGQPISKQDFVKLEGEIFHLLEFRMMLTDDEVHTLLPSVNPEGQVVASSSAPEFESIVGLFVRSRVQPGIQLIFKDRTSLIKTPDQNKHVHRNNHHVPPQLMIEQHRPKPGAPHMGHLPHPSMPFPQQPHHFNHFAPQLVGPVGMPPMAGPPMMPHPMHPQLLLPGVIRRAGIEPLARTGIRHASAFARVCQFPAAEVVQPGGFFFQKQQSVVLPIVSTTTHAPVGPPRSNSFITNAAPCLVEATCSNSTASPFVERPPLFHPRRSTTVSLEGYGSASSHGSHPGVQQLQVGGACRVVRHDSLDSASGLADIAAVYNMNRRSSCPTPPMLMQRVTAASVKQVVPLPVHRQPVVHHAVSSMVTYHGASTTTGATGYSREVQEHGKILVGAAHFRYQHSGSMAW